ncbi:MAG TPA: DNRLRE domain-containing protein, partial [Anaerolineales bacterium]
AYTQPSAVPGGRAVIRDKLNGASVPDAAVGGTITNLCPGGSSFIWNQWGNLSFPGAKDFNIQNQTDVADWPCFAKYYVTFPLDQVPAGKVVLSANLTLYEWGGSDQNLATPSLIQALVVEGDWNENTLTWNNGPRPLENVSQTWVDVFRDVKINWPGKAYNWDMSYAVAKALAAGQPLRLALYASDSDYHSGKYFTSSNADDWDAEGRPTLTVNWGNP